MRRFRVAAAVGALVCSTIVPALPTAAAPARPQVAGPALHVEQLVTGLSIPWDVAPTADGLLYTERAGRVWFRTTGGVARRIAAWMGDLWVSGETGLMAIAIDPAFASNRRVYTCQGTTDRYNTVQVVAWRMDAGYTRMIRVNDPLVGGIDGRSGRHGGCQLRFDTAGRLHIGTGDAAYGTNPQNRWSLAGKTLRVNRFTGAGVSGNLTYGDHRIYTIGHRNVQGLAVAPDGTMYEVEHGTDRDDEINVLIARRNYGWNPVPGYNETRPMTDLVRYPTAVRAVWTSGYPTVATSGAAFLVGSQWGAYNGALAVACLKGSQLRIFRIVNGAVVSQWIPAELDHTYGRLRAAELGPDGALYVTTSNGSADSILRITPA